MRKMLIGGAALLALALPLPPAFAADLPSTKEAPLPPPPAPSGWRFEATINGWAPSLIANVGVRNLPTVTADIGFFKLLEHLNGVAPLTVTARNDNFLFGVDLYWTALSAGAHFKDPVGLGLGGATAHMHLDETILTGFAGVRLPLQAPNLDVFAIAGARYFNIGVDLGLNSALPGFGLTISQSKDWVDPIIGLTGKYALNDKWFLTGEADIGGYSDSLTWQTFGGVGYNWSHNISATLGFRALYVDYEHRNNSDGSFRYQATMLGPQLSVSYAF